MNRFFYPRQMDGAGAEVQRAATAIAAEPAAPFRSDY